MAFPKGQHEEMGQIYVDQRTKDEASHKIKFTYRTHAAFKGKLYKEPIYAPADPDEEFEAFDSLPLERLLLIHSNPFLVDRNSVYQYKKSIMVGRSRLKKGCLKDFANVAKMLSGSSVNIIKGPAGCGKSLFAREVAASIERKDIRGNYHNWDKEKHIKIFASQLNALNKQRYFNHWQIILPAMCHDSAKRHKVNKGEFIETLIKNSEADLSDKLSIIEDLFSVQLPHAYNKKTQYCAKYNPHAFAEKQVLPDIIIETLLKFIVEFFKCYLDEDTSLGVSDANTLSYQPPVVIFLDDAQNMDLESWKLVNELQMGVNRIVIYIVLQSDSEGELKLFSKEVRDFYEVLETNRSINAHYEINGIVATEFIELVRTYNKLHREEIDDEVEAMFQIKDENADEKALKEELKKTFYCSEIMEIEATALNTILNKTESNTLLALQFVKSLLRSKCLKNQNGVLIPSTKFEQYKVLDDWVFTETPDLATRFNSMAIDKTLKATSEKAIITLKAASVLGQIFTLKGLKHITPLRTEGMQDLLKRIHELEKINIIEIIDDDGVSDMTCRFLVPFYRETVYQRLLFREHKKGLHALSAEFILNNIIKIDMHPEAECQRMIVHLLISEDVKHVNELSTKYKRMITIKKLSNLLLKDTKIIKFGLMYKQSDHLAKTIKERYVIVTRDELHYYHSKLEYTKHDPLGIICLRNIGSVIPSEKHQADYYEFVVNSSSWIKKDVLKPHREFFFGTKSEEEREEWITTLEFLKAVAVHRNFQSSFGVKLRIPLDIGDSIQNLFDKKFTLSNSSPSKVNTNLDLITKRKLTAKSNSSSNQDDTSTLSIKGEQLLKEPIKAMFNYMFIHFVGHLMENSMRDDSSTSYKITPKIVQKNKMLERIQTEWSSFSQLFLNKTPVKERKLLATDLLENRRRSTPSLMYRKPEDMHIYKKNSGELLETQVKHESIMEPAAHFNEILHVQAVERGNMDSESDYKFNTKTANPLKPPIASIVASNRRASLKEGIFEFNNKKRPHRLSMFSQLLQNQVDEENKTLLLSPISPCLHPEIIEINEINNETDVEQVKKNKEGSEDIKDIEENNAIRPNETHSNKNSIAIPKQFKSVEQKRECKSSYKKETSQMLINEKEIVSEFSPSKYRRKKEECVLLEFEEKAIPLVEGEENIPEELNGNSKSSELENTLTFKNKKDDKFTGTKETSIMQTQQNNDDRSRLVTPETCIKEKLQNLFEKEKHFKLLTDLRKYSLQNNSSLAFSPSGKHCSGKELKNKSFKKINIKTLYLNDDCFGDHKLELKDDNPIINDQRKNLVEEFNVIKERIEKKITYGTAIREIESIGGDIYRIPEGGVVIIDKLDAEDNLATCSDKGLTGLFPLDAIQVLVK